MLPVAYNIVLRLGRPFPGQAVSGTRKQADRSRCSLRTENPGKTRWRCLRIQENKPVFGKDDDRDTQIACQCYARRI